MAIEFIGIPEGEFFTELEPGIHWVFQEEDEGLMIIKESDVVKVTNDIGEEDFPLKIWTYQLMKPRPRELQPYYPISEIIKIQIP